MQAITDQEKKIADAIEYRNRVSLRLTVYVDGDTVTATGNSADISEWRKANKALNALLTQYAGGQLPVYDKPRYYRNNDNRQLSPKERYERDVLLRKTRALQRKRRKLPAKSE